MAKYRVYKKMSDNNKPKHDDTFADLLGNILKSLGIPPLAKATFNYDTERREPEAQQRNKLSPSLKENHLQLEKNSPKSLSNRTKDIRNHSWQASSSWKNQSAMEREKDTHKSLSNRTRDIKYHPWPAPSSWKNQPVMEREKDIHKSLSNRTRDIKYHPWPAPSSWKNQPAMEREKNTFKSVSNRTRDIKYHPRQAPSSRENQPAMERENNSFKSLSNSTRDIKYHPRLPTSSWENQSSMERKKGLVHLSKKPMLDVDVMESTIRNKPIRNLEDESKDVARPSGRCSADVKWTKMVGSNYEEFPKNMEQISIK